MPMVSSDDPRGQTDPASTMPLINVYVEDGSAWFWLRVPRVPVEGETIIGPDDEPVWDVVSIEFNYASGFYHEPITYVRVRTRG